MEQDYESLQDVERQNILPSFEVRGRVRSRTVRVLSAFIHAVFILAVVVALVGSDWLFAGLLLVLYVLYMKAE